MVKLALLIEIEELAACDLLTTMQQRRLEKLARDAGRTPQVMLRFVLRDGFDLCELEVSESLAAERDAVRRGYVPPVTAAPAPGASQARNRKSTRRVAGRHRIPCARASGPASVPDNERRKRRA